LINVTYLDHMGSDLTVVNAARVSFDKESKYDQHNSANGLDPRDTKLIHYLATHNHWSPFAHPQISFRVSTPVFVARQLQKHTVGLAWNELSRRYVDSVPTFYTPETWRKRAENVKQGSSDEAVYADMIDPDYKHLLHTAEALYNKLVNVLQVAPEQARMVLPQSMMTEFIWTGSLFAFARVCNLRLDSHTQRETQEIAQQISDIIKPLFPVSWEALVARQV